MDGTQKQIEWATSIRETIAPELQSAIIANDLAEQLCLAGVMIERRGKMPDAARNTLTGYANAVVAEILAADNASYWIGIRNKSAHRLIADEIRHTYNNGNMLDIWNA